MFNGSLSFVFRTVANMLQYVSIVLHLLLVHFADLYIRLSELLLVSWWLLHPYTLIIASTNC